MNMWRAGCGGSRTSGSEGGQEKPTSRKADRALLSGPYTYVRTWAGWVYVAFIVDVFAQRIVAWHAATNKETELVMIPLRMALWERDREGRPTVAGELICHADAGSQGGFNWLSQHLVIMEVFDGSSTASSRPSDSPTDEVSGNAVAAA